MAVTRTTLADGLRPRGPIRFKLSERGELDVLTAPRFAVRVEEIVRQCDCDLTVDLRGVQFIDSAALHVLLNAQRRLTRSSRRLTVICDDGPVHRVFELSRLVETLGVQRRP
jgi:anti-sigma B factor antagonist